MKNTARGSESTIDFQRETLLGVTEAAGILPASRGGKRIHISTLHRWASRGLRGVVLETIRVGGRRYTSTEALQRFFDRLSTGAGSAPAEVSGAVIAAEKELERRGF